MSENINFLDESNIGGGWKVSFVDYDGIDWIVFPEEIDNNYADAVVLLDGYDWSHVDFTFDTLLFADKKLENQGYASQITGIIAKDRPKLLKIFEREQKKRHVVIFYDNNGNQILVGKKYEHVKIDVATRESGVTNFNRNQYAVVFTCLSRERQPFYLYIDEDGSDFDADDFVDTDFLTG